MKVRDVMTLNPVTISPEDTVGYALSLIDKFHIWSIPVISKEKIIGIVTKKDIKIRSKNNSQKVSTIMSKTPLTVLPDEELAIAAETLKRTRINALVVSEDNKILGILTKYDVYKKLIFKENKVRCPFCDSIYRDSDGKCPNCGAPKG